jgi:hypothetical protein
MMLAARGLAAIAACFLAAAPAAAQGVPTRVTAKTLAAICAESRATCLAYVVGAADGFSSGANVQIFCIPVNMTNDQLATIALRYVRVHPELDHANAASVVVVALREAFPCAGR